MFAKAQTIPSTRSEQSIAWGCARAVHEAGGELAMTYLNNATKAYTEALADKVNASIFMPLDVTNETQCAVDGGYNIMG